MRLRIENSSEIDPNPINIDLHLKLARFLRTDLPHLPGRIMSCFHFPVPILYCRKVEYLKRELHVPPAITGLLISDEQGSVSVAITPGR